MITLHDHLNPDYEVLVQAAGIIAITAPYGSGSILHLASGAPIGVHESPSEVIKLIQGEQK